MLKHLQVSSNIRDTLADIVRCLQISTNIKDILEHILTFP